MIVKYFKWLVAVILHFSLLTLLACSGSEGKSLQTGEEKPFQLVVDMRGAEVKVPKKIERIVDISDGFTAGVLYHLGLVEKIVGVGSRCQQLNYRYDFPSEEGKNYGYENGLNPVTFLHPRLQELPLVAASNLALNFETLAGLQPDVVLLRVGSCTYGSLNDDQTQKAISTIEAIGIPVIVLKGPPCFDQPTLEYITEEIRLIGRLFDREKAALTLANFLADQTRIIKERTQDIPEEQKQRLFMLGLSPRVRASGGAGNTKGEDTIESFFMEEVANAKNAYEGMGGKSSYLIVSAEQIYALDPDVILLPTSSGYHPSNELYTAPYFQNLRSLKAVIEKRVYALPWTPCNCAKRMEYPIEMMIIAKAAYPERFADVKVHQWVLKFYEQLFGVDETTAKKIRSTQWLDWMEEQDF